MLKKTRKKAISVAFTYFMLVFSFFACFSISVYALPASDDWSRSYLNLNSIVGMGASGGMGDISATSLTKGLVQHMDGTKGLSISGSFNDLLYMGNDTLYFVNYGSNYMYIYDTYHYTVTLSCKTMISNNGEVLSYPSNFNFVLCSALQTGSGVGNYYISNQISPSSSYKDGDNTYFVFDFDISLSDDWPSATVSDGKALFTGFGVVYTSGMLFGTYDVTVGINDMYVKSYSADEWHDYVVEHSIDKAATTIVDGFQHLDDATKDKLDSSISDYNEAEEGIFDSLFSIVDDNVGYDFDFKDSLAAYTHSFEKVSLWVQYVYNNIPIVRIAIDVGFSLALFLLVLKAV